MYAIKASDISFYRCMGFLWDCFVFCQQHIGYDSLVQSSRILHIQGYLQMGDTVSNPYHFSVIICKLEILGRTNILDNIMILFFVSALIRRDWKNLGNPYLMLPENTEQKE